CQNLFASHAPSDHQRPAARLGRGADRHPSCRDKIVKQRHRISDHQRLQYLRYATDVRHAVRAVRTGDRCERAHWKARRVAYHQKKLGRSAKKGRYIMKRFHMLGAAAIAMSALTGSAAADDLVKMTIGQRGNW